MGGERTMSEDQATRPMANLLAAAREGTATVFNAC